MARIEAKLVASTTIGTPSDGDYTDGFFDHWTPSTPVADAVDEISETFLEIAPAKAGILTGFALALSGTTQYQGRLPSGLSGSWGAYTPGQLVSNLIVDGSYVLTTPDAASRFRAGKAVDPSTAGVLTRLEGGSPVETYDIGVNGVGSAGNLEVTALDPYNALWLKANARIIFVQVVEGLIEHALEHTEAGLSATTVLHFDDVNPSPTFAGAPAHSVNVEVLKYLSGIAYYTTGTIFFVTYAGASGIFQKAYHPTQVSRLQVTGAPDKAVNPPSVPDVLDQFVVVDEPLTLSQANQAILSTSILVTLFKPDGANVSLGTALARGINTYGVVSTTTQDDFQDEDKRLVLNTATPWTPSATLVDGNLQVRNGTLLHGNDGDYAGFSGDQEYQRKIAKTAASGGVLRHTSIASADIDPYGTGDINVLLQLETDGKFFDLGRVVGDNNGTGSGDDRANSLGGKVSGAGADTTFSFLTFSTGNNNQEYRVIVIFRTIGKSITFLRGT